MSFISLIKSKDKLEHLTTSIEEDIDEALEAHRIHRKIPISPRDRTFLYAHKFLNRADRLVKRLMEARKRLKDVDG